MHISLLNSELLLCLASFQHQDIYDNFNLVKRIFSWEGVKKSRELALRGSLINLKYVFLNVYVHIQISSASCNQTCLEAYKKYFHEIKGLPKQPILLPFGSSTEQIMPTGIGFQGKVSCLRYYVAIHHSPRLDSPPTWHELLISVTIVLTPRVAA